MRIGPWTVVACALAAPVLQAASLSGVVSDSSGAVVREATVEVLAGTGTVIARLRTDVQGRFHWDRTSSAPLRVSASAEGLGMREILVPPGGDHEVRIELQPHAASAQVTVTAERGGAEDIETSAYVVSVKNLTELRKRPMATLGNALEQEPGILLQQSTYGQVSPFLRGLTGYQVLNLVDGIRFNNSTFRSGPNQYLAFIEPSQANRVEAMLGPTGVQYGSDSLGGTIQVFTREPRFAAQKVWETHGELRLGGATADLSGIGAAHVTVSGERFFWLGGVSGRKHNDLRAGRGWDSRNVYHRLFGMPPGDVESLLGSRQQDSGFRQYGVETKFAYRPRPTDLLTLNYQRGLQDGVRGYKDLLGGLGRLQSAFTPQTLNWLYGRYERLHLSVFDSVSGTVSLNSQTDGSVRQNLQFTDPVTRDDNRVNAYGYTAQATTHRGSRLIASFGGDLYDESIRSRREIANPATGPVSRPRPLYPDRSRYQNLGAFGQTSVQLTGSLRASGGIRFTGVRFATREDQRIGVPESSQWFRDVTFHSALRWQATAALGLHAVVSRGFRAPNLNDLGALGLNDLGYEIPAAEAIPSGALLSTDSGEGAVSKGLRLTALAPESLMNYEFGARFTVRRVYARVQMFHAGLSDPIVRRTVLFPAAGAPSQLAGLPVTPIPQTAAQRAQGVVTVATAFDPRAVKAFVNDGRSRYYGVESLLRLPLTQRLAWEANYTFIVGRDLDPNRNIRRLPPQMGSATLRYTPSGRKPWWEISMAASGAQTRLSGGDRDDERIGASFRRRDIADFFRGGRAAAFVDPASGIFRPTGETLAQIQNRVLPIGAAVNGVRVANDDTRVPLYLSTAGWVTLSVRSGIPLGERWMAMAAIENLADRNYRFHGSGVDAPGFHAYLSMSYRF